MHSQALLVQSSTHMIDPSVGQNSSKLKVEGFKCVGKKFVLFLYFIFRLCTDILLCSCSIGVTICYVNVHLYIAIINM